VPIPLAPIIAGAAALGGVGLVIKARSNAAKAQLAAECEDLRTQLELASVAPSCFKSRSGPGDNFSRSNRACSELRSSTTTARWPYPSPAL